MLILPSNSQQWALAYAPKPFALLSFLSSSYVVDHLLHRQRGKCKRLYHRLVLAMNLAVMLLSFAYFYGNWAVPVGTPGYVGAVGNVQSCTAFGFIALMMAQTVPIYYCSLGIQAFMAIRNNFKEEKYVWIEKWFHYVAWAVPCSITTVVAATQNINPIASNCWFAKSPRGCETDPKVQCERGRDIALLIDIFGAGQVLLYFIFPPAGVLAIFFYIKRRQKRINRSASEGVQLARAAAQKRVLRSVGVQISVYLLSFWFTTVFSLTNEAYVMVTGEVLYTLLIFADVVYSSQGFVIAMVYFTLEKIGRPETQQGLSLVFGDMSGMQLTNRTNQATVSDIRRSAATMRRRTSHDNEPIDPGTFHIFDGPSEANSPWTLYFNENGDEENDDIKGEEPTDEFSSQNDVENDAIKEEQTTDEFSLHNDKGNGVIKQEEPTD